MTQRSLDLRAVALAAVMTALVAVFTLYVRVPFAPTRGYFSFADVGVFFAAFAFGPWVGLVAGGLGTAIADVLGGYAHFAVWSFLIHGAQGLVAGLVTGRLSRGALVAGWLLGSVIMTGGYFLVELPLYGLGPALAELWQVNVWQVIAGGLIAGPLVLAVRRAYPPLQRLRWGPTVGRS